MILYVYDGGDFYPVDAVDHDPATGVPDSDGYTRYEVPDTITFKADALFNCSGSLLELLHRTKQIKRA